MHISKSARQAHDDLLKLGDMSVRMAAIERAVHYPPGRPENDAEHSFHLALSAVEMAAEYYPELDVGLVAQFSIVHDLAEIHTGDVPTFGISPEKRAAKEAAEKLSVKRLLKELPPHTAQLLKRYEDQTEPEAKFVRFIDKLLPAVIHAIATGANKDVFQKTYGLKSSKDLQTGIDERIALLQQMFPEFELIHAVHDLVSATSNERLFGKDS